MRTICVTMLAVLCLSGLAHAQTFAVDAVVQIGIYTVVSPVSGFGTDRLPGANNQCAIGFGGSVKVIAIIDNAAENSSYFVKYTPSASVIPSQCRGDSAYFDMSDKELVTQQARRDAIVANPPTP